MAVILQTWGEQLADVVKAIEAVQTSQRYEINGRSVQRADLQWLNKRYEYLVSKVEAYGADTIMGNATTRANVKVSFTND